MVNETKRRWGITSLDFVYYTKRCCPGVGDATDSTWSHVTVCSKFYVLSTHMFICLRSSSVVTQPPDEEKKNRRAGTFAVTFSLYVRAKGMTQRPRCTLLLTACCYDGACAQPGCELRNLAAVSPWDVCLISERENNASERVMVLALRFAITSSRWWFLGGCRCSHFDAGTNSQAGLLNLPKYLWEITLRCPNFLVVVSHVWRG